MRLTIKSLALAAFLLPGIAAAQVPQFPQNLPPNTVVGRLGIGPGPSQAIPFANLLAQLPGAQPANKIWAGPASGAASFPTFRALTYADILPGFSSGRPWCDVRSQGAVGDGVTNDAAAFRSCVSTLVALGGGILYVPPSTNPYCVIDGTSGILLTSATAFIRIIGSDEANAVLSACGNNSFPVVKMNTPHSSLENVYVLGYGMRSTDTFGIAANPAVLFQSLCSFCRIMNSTVNGGNFNVQLQNSNYLFINVTAQYAYSTALIYATNGGGAFDGGNHFNQVWPVSVPAHNATLNAWAGTSACSAGQVVSTAGFYIQYTGSGTTGGSAPTLKNYGQSITDGSCSAFLVGPTTYYGIQADSGVNEMQILHTDMTGAFTAGLAMTNTLATTAPTSVSVSESTIGQTTTFGIFASAGSELSTNNLHISRCIAAGCVGVDLTNAWAGPANINGLRVFNNISYGIFIGAGAGANITNSYIYTADLSSITVSANINQFNILGSSLCTSSLGTSTNAITVTAGTSDKYNIIGNDTTGCSGSGIVDNGSGTNKLVGGNGPWSAANGGTGRQTLTNHGVLVGAGTGAITQLAVGTTGLPLVGATGADPAFGVLPVAGGGTNYTGGALTTYTPTLACGTGTLTSASTTGHFLQIGKFVAYNIDIVVTTNGTCATFLSATLPTTAGFRSAAVGRNNASGRVVLGTASAASSTFAMTLDAGTYPITDGQSITVNGTYEAQ